MSEERPGFWEVFARRPLVLEIVAAFVLLVGILVVTSNAGMSLVSFILIALVALALGGLWCLHWIASLAARARGDLRRALTAREWLAWAVLPALLLGGYVQAKLDLTLRLRFAVSRSAFEEYDETAEEGKAIPESLGLYDVKQVYFWDERPHIATSRSGLLDFAGFVRWPEGPPARRGPYEYSRLTGKWYVFAWSD